MAEQKTGITLFVKDEVSKTVKKLAKRAKIVGKAFSAALSVVRGIGQAIVVANNATDLLSKGFGAVSGVMTGAVDAAVELRGASDPLIRQFNKMGSAAKGIQGAFGDAFIIAIATVGKALGPTIKKFKEFAENNKQLIAEKTVELIFDFANLLLTGLTKGATAAVTAVTSFKKSLMLVDSLQADVVISTADMVLAIHEGMGSFSPFGKEAVDGMRLAKKGAEDTIRDIVKRNDELDESQLKANRSINKTSTTLRQALAGAARTAAKEVKNLVKASGAAPMENLDQGINRVKDRIADMVPSLRTAAEAIGKNKSFEEGRLAYEQVEQQIDLVNRSLEFTSTKTMPGVVEQMKAIYESLGLEFKFNIDTKNLEKGKEQLMLTSAALEAFVLDSKEGINLVNDALEQEAAKQQAVKDALLATAEAKKVLAKEQREANTLTNKFKDLVSETPGLLSSFAEEAGSAFMDIANGAKTAGEAFAGLALSLLTSIIGMVQKAVLAFAVQAAASAMAGNSGAPGIGLIIGAAMGAAALGMVKGLLSNLPSPEGMAAGGMVRGGVANRDSVPAMLMPGEVVVPKRHVDALRDAEGNGGGGGTNIQINTTVPPSRAEMKRYLRQNLVPAMRELKSQGVMV